MAQQHTRAGRFQASIGGLVLGSIVLAYFLGPLLRFASPEALGWGGLLLGGGLFATYQVATVTTLGRSVKWVGYAVGGLGLLFLIIAFASAMTNSGKFDRRCAKLQQVMLNGGKQPKDGNAQAHEIFDALACRPQM